MSITRKPEASPQVSLPLSKMDFPVSTVGITAGVVAHACDSSIWEPEEGGCQA
jgi:hypothetical protein